MGDFFYPFIYTQYQEDIPVQSTNQPRYFSIPHQVSAVDHPFPQVPLHQGGGCSGWMWIPWGKTGFGCFFFGGGGGQIRKKTTTWYPKQPSFNGLMKQPFFM